MSKQQKSKKSKSKGKQAKKQATLMKFLIPIAIVSLVIGSYFVFFSSEPVEENPLTREITCVNVSGYSLTFNMTIYSLDVSELEESEFDNVTIANYSIYAIESDISDYIFIANESYSYFALINKTGFHEKSTDIYQRNNQVTLLKVPISIRGISISEYLETNMTEGLGKTWEITIQMLDENNQTDINSGYEKAFNFSSNENWSPVFIVDFDNLTSIDDVSLSCGYLNETEINSGRGIAFELPMRLNGQTKFTLSYTGERKTDAVGLGYAPIFSDGYPLVFFQDW